MQHVGCSNDDSYAIYFSQLCYVMCSANYCSFYFSVAVFQVWAVSGLAVEINPFFYVWSCLSDKYFDTCM